MKIIHLDLLLMTKVYVVGVESMRKRSLDWNHRFEELKKIVSRYKTDKAKYDCIIPVSGGKDSFFIVDVVKNRLGMKPLLVSYNKLFNSSVGIENLANLRVQFDCDFIQKNINPEIAKKITRRTLYKYGNPYWHCIAGETVFPVQIAVQLKIPLIIWGAHQGLEQVGMYSHLDNVEMTRDTGMIMIFLVLNQKIYQIPMMILKIMI